MLSSIQEIRASNPTIIRLLAQMMSPPTNLIMIDLPDLAVSVVKEVVDARRDFFVIIGSWPNRPPVGLVRLFLR